MTTTAIQARRQFITQPGEQLLITREALTSAERLIEFIDATGLVPEAIVSDPVVTVPLPIYSRERRFSDVNPEALWNPLFWLPEDIALRFRIRETESAEPRPESDAEWALRIAVELSDSGIYNAEEGWLDVFALYGIDPNDPIDLARVEAWQAGLPDETLDGINLRDHVSFTTDNLAFEDAQELYPFLVSAQWGYTAASLLAAVETDPEGVGTYAGLAAEMLSSEPSSASDELFDASKALSEGDSPNTWGPSLVRLAHAAGWQWRRPCAI